jgi:hypothetical protein
MEKPGEGANSSAHSRLCAACISGSFSKITLMKQLTLIFIITEPNRRGCLTFLVLKKYFY